MNYLVYSLEPGTCYVYTLIKNGVSDYGNTVQEIQDKHPDRNFELIDEPELLRRLDIHYDSYKTFWKPISKSDWWELLEVLPPCRWHHNGAAEVFHVSERLTGNLVTWCMRVDDRYYSCIQDASIPSNELCALPLMENAA